MKNGKIGSDFDDFLLEKGIYNECVSMAAKAIIAEQIAELMKAQNITKSEMAAKMHTSRTALSRLLDPLNDSVTLDSLKRAADLLGRKIRLELVPA